VFCFAYGSISDGIPGKTHRQKQGKKEKKTENKYEGEKRQLQRVQYTLKKNIQFFKFKF